MSIWVKHETLKLNGICEQPGGQKQTFRLIIIFQFHGKRPKNLLHLEGAEADSMP